MVTGCGGALSTPPACAKSIGFSYVLASTGALSSGSLTSDFLADMVLVSSVYSFRRITGFAIPGALFVWLESSLESAHAHRRPGRAFREVGQPTCPDQS